MNKKYLLLAAVLLLQSSLFAQHHSEYERYVPETDSLVLQKLEHWQDLKFGLLMHWGPYSQWGIVESWSICAEDEDWCRRPHEDYIAYKKAYENLITTFNPVGFEPERWAAAAARAGMKYMVFTTKHHDGFSMFDTQYTDYKITSGRCPFHAHPKANITREIFDAFRAHDLWVGAYFSKPDWNNENYWWPNFATPDRNVNYDPVVYPERWENFVQFTHNQIMELLTDYGDVDILWLDGGWVAKKTPETIRRAYERRLQDHASGFLKAQVINQDIRMDELVVKAREAQPGLIVVDRAVYGKNQNYLTPENRVPDQMLPYPWESCIISGGGWSHTPDAEYISGHQGVHLLVDIVAKGGNLLLNVAPGPDGTWQQGAYDLLQEMGTWLQTNGEAIYATRAIAPFKTGNIAFTQGKAGQIYAIYLAEETEKNLPAEIHIPNMNLSPDSKIELLGTTRALSWKVFNDGITVSIPRNMRNNAPSQYAWSLKISQP